MWERGKRLLTSARKKNKCNFKLISSIFSIKLNNIPFEKLCIVEAIKSVLKMKKLFSKMFCLTNKNKCG